MLDYIWTDGSLEIQRAEVIDLFIFQQELIVWTHFLNHTSLCKFVEVSRI